MTILTIIATDIKSENAKETFLSLFNFFAIGIKIGVKDGTLIGLSICIWKLEIFVSLKHWEFNVTTHRIKDMQ